MNSDSVKELRDLFQKIDTDDSGQIDFEEFKSSLRAHTELHDDDLHKIFDNIDRTHSGLIDYTEFIAACLWSSKTLVSVPCAVCDPIMMIHLPYTAGAHPSSLYGR